MTKDLIEGAYYYTENGIEKAHYCEVNGVRELVTPKGEVLYPVPNYERFKALYEIELAALDLKDEKQQLKGLLERTLPYILAIRNCFTGATPEQVEMFVKQIEEALK